MTDVVVDPATPAAPAASVPSSHAGGTRFGLRQYVTLVRTLAASEFKLRFAHSALGYAWTLSKPLMLFGIMYVVFSRMLRFGEGIPFYPVVLLMGIMAWGFFAESTGGAVTVLVNRADLIRKASFPRSALAMSVVTTSLLVFLCNLVALGLFVLLAGVDPRLTWLLLPLLLVELTVLTVGASLLLSGLFVFLRDIGQLWAVMLQLLFYATPIIYPIELLYDQGVSDGWIRVLVANPIAQMIQDARWSLVGPSTRNSVDVLGPLAFVPFLITAVILVSGMVVYRRFAGRLAEHV